MPDAWYNLSLQKDIAGCQYCNNRDQYYVYELQVHDLKYSTNGEEERTYNRSLRDAADIYNQMTNMNKVLPRRQEEKQYGAVPDMKTQYSRKMTRHPQQPLKPRHSSP